MAKEKKDVFDLDDESMVVTKAIEPTVATIETIDEGRPPSLEELRKAPKSKETGGDGPGGRPWVLAKTGLRRPMQGDQNRPQCPSCSNDQLAVLTGAVSSPRGSESPTTWYKCPCCSFSVQRLRPGLAESFRQSAQKPSKPFVERPS